MKTNITSKQELGFTNRGEVPSSRQFTNRLNTLCTSEDNLMTEELEQNGFGTIAAVTRNPNSIPKVAVDNFMHYSKAKDNQK